MRLGNGDGTFRQPSATAASWATQSFSFAAAGDFNGDGIPDVAQTSAYHDGVLAIWFGIGDGTFRPGPILETEDYYGKKPLVIGDFNRDGKLDVAISLGDLPFNVGVPTGVEIFAGNGDGTFRPGVVVPTLAAGGIVAGDFNGDGKLDPASGPAILLGNGDGRFQAPAYFPDGHPQASAALAVDLNGDGRPDLVLIPNANVRSTDPSAVSILANNSPGSSNSVFAVQVASGAATIAPDSLASIYDSRLASQTAAASGMWPTELGGIRLHVRDSALTDRLAQLVYVSPSQINFLVPSGTATGWATLTVDNGTNFEHGTRATMVTALSPGFFTVDGKPARVAAATAIRVLPDGTRQDVPVFACSGADACTAMPLDLDSGLVYLTLYGTGLRTARGTKCYVDSNLYRSDLEVTYSGPQSTIAGLDQVNIFLRTPLASGIRSVICYFSDGHNSIASNAVQIRIK